MTSKRQCMEGEVQPRLRAYLLSLGLLKNNIVINLDMPLDPEEGKKASG